MSTEENKVIARRWAIDLWAKGDLTVADEIVSSTYVHNGSPRSIEELKQSVRNLHAAYPDIKVTLEEQIAEGDKVVNRIIGYATGTDMNIRAVQIDIFRIVNGKIEEFRDLRKDLDDSNN